MPDYSIFRDPLLFQEKTTEPIDPKTALSYSEIKYSPSQTSDRYTGIDPVEYDKYTNNSTYSSLGEEYLNKQRAQNQTGSEQFLGFLNQAVVGEIGGGTIEGIGYLLDLESYGKLANGTEKEFGNWFSNIGKSMRTWSEEATPIYTDPDAPKFDPGNFAWWMQNGKSIASTVSLMVPSGIAVRGLKVVGELLKGYQKLSPMAKWATTGVAQAAISRHMENMMEASGVQQEMYKKGLQKGMTVAEAEEYAAMAASKTYKLDWAMFLQDLPQYLLLNRAGAGKGGGLLGKVGALSERSLTAASMMGEKLLPVIGSKAAAIGWDMIGEGFEEGYQFIAAEEGKYMAEKYRDPSVTSSFDTRLNKYVKDGEFWTSAVMGALGAGVMQTAGKAINDAIQGGDAQTRFLKEFGGRLSHAASLVRQADLIGTESGKKSAIMQLENAVFTKGASLERMADVKELLKRSAELSKDEMNEFGISEEDLQTLGLNAEEMISHADQFEKLWEKNKKEHSSDPEKAAAITQQEYVIDTFNKYKQDYSGRLDELKGNVTNFNSLSFEAQDIFAMSSQILAKEKLIAFQEKRLANTKNPVNAEQKKQIEASIAGTKKRIEQLKGDMDMLESSLPTYADTDGAIKKTDDDVNIGGPRNLLNAKDESEITGHPIVEYKKLSETLEFADLALTAAQDELKKILTGKKAPTKPKPAEPTIKDRIPESDDYVLRTDDPKFTGIVDYIDEDGNYVVIPTTKWDESSKYATRPSGTAVTIPADKVVLDKKQYVEDNIQEEAISEEDMARDVTYDNEDRSQKYLEISYMLDPGNGKVPVTSNEDLNLFLTNPSSDFTGIVAEMYIDTESDYAKAMWDKILGDIRINKLPLTDKEKSLILRRVKNGKLTDSDIKEFQAKYKISYDDIPIAVQLIKDNKVLFKGGMFYHVTDFKQNKPPAYIAAQGKERADRYLYDQKNDLRRTRFVVIPELLKGNTVYSDTLRRGSGHYNNSENRGNVLERHGLAISEGRIAISRQDGKIHLANGQIVAGVNTNSAGTPFAPTKKTIDGKENWAKINPTKLTEEHAEILWDAIVDRYTKGGRMTPFRDERVSGMNVGEVIDMLVLMGEIKTNIDHKSFVGEKREDLRNKTLFVNSGHLLTFGNTKPGGTGMTIDLYEDNIATEMANKEAFIKWAMKNKNYSIPIANKTMGVGLNLPLKRTFKIGKWENKADEKGNFLTTAQFLMSVAVDGGKKFAVESDLQEYENTGSAFTRPSLQFGDNAYAFKIKKREVTTSEKKSKDKTTEPIKPSTTPIKIVSDANLINLPVGTVLYYNEPIIKDGQVTEETKPAIIAEVINDNKFGRVLNLRGWRVKYAPGDWLRLEVDDTSQDTNTLKQIHGNLAALIRSFNNHDLAKTGVYADTSNAKSRKEKEADVKTEKEEFDATVNILASLPMHESSSTGILGQELFDKLPDSKDYNQIVSKLYHDKTITKEEYQKRIDIAYNELIRERALFITEAYFKARADGSNPEFVKAIKDLLSKHSTVQNTVVPKSETTEEKKPYKKDEDIADAANDIFGNGIPMQAEFETPVTSIIDLPKELAWFHERFGKQNVQESDKLLRIAADGRLAFSVFTSDCIYVFTGAPQGALYHEAFHRVVLGYLTEGDRQRVFASARKQFGLPNATDTEISEKLAEDFRAYKLNGTKPKSRTVWQFFQDLYNFIVSYFTGRSKLSSFEISKLYDSINRGQFRYGKINEDNAKRLEGVQTPMAIEIHKRAISTIDNEHDLDKIIKFLTGVLIQTNEIENLNDIPNIKMSRMFTYVENMVDRMENAIKNTNQKLADGTIAAEDIQKNKDFVKMFEGSIAAFNTVLSLNYRDLFVDKIGDMLSKMNIKRVKDEDALMDDISEDNYKDRYNKESYTINSKDNLLASVKFLIATLPKTGKLDPHIGVPELVDFTEMWNSLMHNLYDINNTADMMDRLNAFADKHPYKVLIDKLNADKTGFKKEQVRAAVQKHRHDFVNFLLKLSREDGPPTIEITQADVASASRLVVRDWNLMFDGSKLFTINEDGSIALDKERATKISTDYKAFAERVEKAFKAGNGVFADKQPIIETFIILLKRIGIHNVDALTVEELIKQRPAQSTDDALFQTIVGDFSRIFNKILTIDKKNVLKMFDDEKSVRSLSEAFVMTHPELISDTILGPSNNLYFIYSQNSYVSDIARKIRTDKTFLEERLKMMYNDNSYYGQQLLADDKVREGMKISTFSMLTERGGTGNDYLDINPIEDYVFKLTAMANGIIAFPTMADRGTYYMLKGLKPLKFKYVPNREGGYDLPNEAIDTLLGYAKSERRRIAEAEKTIAAYETAKESGNVERINELEKDLVEQYHYIIKDDKKLFGKAHSGALIYHNFPSFNKEGFDFDRDARAEIIKSINDNIQEELDYAESLGIIGGTNDILTGKKRYYNRLIPLGGNKNVTDLITEGVADYGNTDMAVRNAIASHFVNTVIANNEVAKLFSGDPAFYKKDKVTKRVIEDNVKRLGALTSTGDNFSNSVSEQELFNTSFNIVTVATQKFMSINYPSLFKDHLDIQKRVLKAENPTLSDEEIQTKAEKYVTEILAPYESMDPTDGQGWISPAMYRSLSIRLGEWSAEKQTAFDLLTLDRELTLEEEKLVLKVTFQPLKLVYFGLLHDSGLAIPTYHKASFATVFRGITKGKHGDRQILDMLDRMEGKGKYQEEVGKERLQKVDMFMMDSATKVGNRAKSKMLDENLEEWNDLSNVTVYQQPFEYLRRQLITDAHDVDRTKTGTQFLKVVLGDLFLDSDEYFIDGKKRNGRYVRDIAFHALTSLSNRGRASLDKKLGYSNGRVNRAKLVELLSEDAKKSNASDNLLDAIVMMGDKDMYLELDSLTDHKWIQSRIISLISKYTIDVNMPGNSLIQFANLGMRSINKKYTFEEEVKGKNKHVAWIKGATDDLQYMRLENGKVVPMGTIVSINLFKHIIPHYDEISYADKVKYLSDNPEVLGYRIPTQGQNSVFMLRVVGIYPETIGDTITLPTEFTALTGSDFDIDKIYAVRYNYVLRKGKFEKVKFIDGDTNDEKVLKEIYNVRYGKLLGAWKMVRMENDERTEEFSKDTIDRLNQMTEVTDDIQVEEWLKKLISIGKWDGPLFTKINDELKHIGMDNFIKENKGKSIYDINNRKAVENRLLDSFFAVMRSEAHYPSTSAPLGPLTQRLKDKASDIRKVQDIEKPNMYHQSPRFNEESKFAYNGGKDGIGPFALNNVHHILSQLAELEMRWSFGDVFNRSTTGNIDLSKHKGKDGILISNWFSALIDAHVDVAKDPYIMDLNVNKYTYNVISLLLRGGVGERSFDFLSQPILKELAREKLLADNSDGSHPLVKRIQVEDGVDEENGQVKYKDIYDIDAYIANKYASKLSEEGKEKYNKLSSQPWEAFSDKLQADMVTTDTTNEDFIIRQLIVFNAFKELYTKGESLNTLVQASQIDTKKFGSNITELRVFMNKLRKAWAMKVNETDNLFVNIEKVLPFNPETGEAIDVEGANFLGAYAANAIKYSLDIMGDISIYGTPVFNELFNTVIRNTGNEFTTDKKFINFVSDEIFSAVVAKFFTSKEYAGITSEGLAVLMNNIVNRFSKIKSNEDGVYDSIKDNAFIKYLYPYPVEDDMLPFRRFLTVPMKSTKDKLDKDIMINSFKELMKSSDPEVRILARQLFYYSFFTSGFRSRIYSYFTLLPNELFKEIEVKDPNDPDTMTIRSYNEMIKKILVEMQNISGALSYSSIVEEVILNNHDNNKLIKLIKASGISNVIRNFRGKSGSYPVAVMLNQKTATKLRLGFNGKTTIYRPYIKVRSEQLGYLVMKYVGYVKVPIGTDALGRPTFETQPVYVTQNRRSYNSRGIVVKEFFMDKSIIAEYNKINTVSALEEEEFMGEISKQFKGAEVTYVPKRDQIILNNTPEIEETDEEDTTEPEITNTSTTLGKVTRTDEYIIRPDLVSNRNKLYIFGDNTDRKGFGGQAADMRGEPNAVGVRTKLHPNNQEESFMTDNDLELNKQMIREDIDNVINTFRNGNYEELVIPKIGIGFAKLPIKAPKTFAFLQSELDRLTNTLQDEEQEERRKEGREKRGVQISTPIMSTKDEPLVIFVDGSDVNKQSTDNRIGYGASFTYNGREYGLSGTKTDVDRLLSQFAGTKMSNPTMEMLGLLEVLNRFKSTKEHIVVRQDYSGSVNYAGLWEHSVGSEQRADKPWVAKEPYIKYIVEEINKAIAELEKNGGSFKVLWVPGHIDSSKITKYPGIFKDSNGEHSQTMVDRLTTGNNMADSHATNAESYDHMSSVIKGTAPTTGFQGYKGGFENVGKGTPEGDGKDKAMREVADGAIGELRGGRRETSTSASMQYFMDEKWSYYPEEQDTVSSVQPDAKVVMLARNGSLSGKPLLAQTKQYISTANDNGISFVVGDMPGVDSQFIDYLQEIGASFTVYHTGDTSRIQVKSASTPIQLTLFDNATNITDEQANEREKKCE
jgi:hypothetical protein